VVSRHLQILGALQIVVFTAGGETGIGWGLGKFKKFIMIFLVP
jgi:hypothetical protein